MRHTSHEANILARRRSLGGRRSVVCLYAPAAVGSYPIDLLHPEVDAWFLTLHARPAFANGLANTEETKRFVAQNRRIQEENGQTLPEIAGWQ